MLTAASLKGLPNYHWSHSTAFPAGVRHGWSSETLLQGGHPGKVSRVAHAIFDPAPVAHVLLGASSARVMSLGGSPLYEHSCSSGCSGLCEDRDTVGRLDAVF